MPHPDLITRMLHEALPLADCLARLGGRSGVVSDAFRYDPEQQDYSLRALQLAAGLADHAEIMSDVRVWKDGQRVPVGKWSQWALEQADALPMRDWADQVMGDAPFAIVLTNIERFDEAAAHAVANYLQPLVSQSDDLVSVNLGVFSGRYDYSPLGIHNDDNLSRVVHFHTGPGTKTMMTWPFSLAMDAAYGKTPDAERRDCASKLSARPGDFLALELPCYHVGEAPELCTNVDLLFERYQPEKVIRDTLRELCWWRKKEWHSWSDGRADTAKLVPHGWASESWQAVSDHCLLLEQARLRSNGGLSQPLIRRASKLSLPASIVLREPDLFPAVMVEGMGSHVLALRGSLRLLPGDEKLVEWTRRFAAGEPMQSVELLGAGADRALIAERIFFLTWLQASQGAQFTPVD